MTHLDDAFDDRPKQRRVGQRVNLSDLAAEAQVDVGDDRDDRHAVEQGLAEPVIALVQAGAGNHGEDPDAAGHPRPRRRP